MRIYFDVCCLNRPFDDQAQDRIHLEAEAVIAILRHIEHHDWLLIGSGIINHEINKIPNDERKARLRSLIKDAGVFIAISQETHLRAIHIQKLGIRAHDALHVACAEQGKADVLLSTDDNFIKIAKRNLGEIGVEIENPLAWLQKMV